MKRILYIFLLFLIITKGVFAYDYAALTYNFVAGQLISASKVMQNYNDVLTGITSGTYKVNFAEIYIVDDLLVDDDKDITVKNVSMTGDLSLTTGNVTVSGNLNITGNLTVVGESTITTGNYDRLNVSDNAIIDDYIGVGTDTPFNGDLFGGVEISKNLAALKIEGSTYATVFLTDTGAPLVEKVFEIYNENGTVSLRSRDDSYLSIEQNFLQFDMTNGETTVSNELNLNDGFVSGTTDLSSNQLTGLTSITATTGTFDDLGDVDCDRIGIGEVVATAEININTDTPVLRIDSVTNSKTGAANLIMLSDSPFKPTIFMGDSSDVFDSQIQYDAGDLKLGVGGNNYLSVETGQILVDGQIESSTTTTDNIRIVHGSGSAEIDVDSNGYFNIDPSDQVMSFFNETDPDDYQWAPSADEGNLILTGQNDGTTSYGVLALASTYTTEIVSQTCGIMMFNQALSGKSSANSGLKAWIRAVTTGSGGGTGGYGGQLEFATRGDNVSGLPTTRMTIANNGLVTIEENLNVNSGLIAIAPDTAITAQLELNAGVGNASAVEFLENSSTKAIIDYNPTSTDLRFRNNSQDGLIIDSSGGVEMPNMTTTGTGNPVYITSAGILWENTSSIRFKKDIRNKYFNTSGLYSFNPVDFVYKDSDIQSWGYIAEEIQKTNPELINYELDGITPRGIDYAKITVLLVEEIKNLNDRIKVLEGQ